MGFSPLKNHHQPLLPREQLSFTGKLGRDLKGAAKDVQRGAKAAAMVLPNLRKQILSKDPAQKPTRWIDPGRKTERNAIREQAERMLLDAYQSTLGGHHQANEKLEMVAEGVMKRLEQEKRIPAGSADTFKGANRDFVMQAPDEQRRRLPPDEAKAKLCQTSIAKAWMQAGLADEAWLVRKALDAYQGALNSQDPAQKKHASAMQKVAEKVIRELETAGHIPEGSLKTFKGDGTSFVEDTPANQRRRLPSHGAQEALVEVLIGQAWRQAGLIPDAMVYLDKAELTVAQVKAHYGLPEVGVGPTVHERAAAAKAAEAAAAEAKEEMERVDTAMATYSLVVKGARPEGSTETLDNDQLHAVACGALYLLQLEGRITPAEFKQFVHQGGDFMGNNEREYAKRFPQGGPDGLLTRELCQATVGQAWHRALLAQKGEPKRITRKAVAAWEERGNPLQEELPPITPRVEVSPQEPTPPDVPVPAPFTLGGFIEDALSSIVSLVKPDPSNPLPEAAPPESPPVPVAVPDSLPAKGSSVPVPAPLTLEQKMAQVDIALAAYGLVLVGERPEGSTQSLDKHALHVLAISAMTKLADEGWITRTDLNRFVNQDGVITDETREQRAQRFPQGEGQNREDVRKLCEAAIGYAWDGALRGAADGPRARPAPETIFTPETILAGHPSSARAQPVVPAVPAANEHKPVAPTEQAQPEPSVGAKAPQKLNEAQRQAAQQIRLMSRALKTFDVAVDFDRYEDCEIVHTPAQLQALAVEAMQELQSKGLITSDELAGFVSDGTSIADEEPTDRVHRFPSSADLGQRWKIALCKAAIGQKWANAGVVWGLGLAENHSDVVITAEMARTWYFRST